ncbi:hypothetical protein [Streptomyces sp. 8L]|uniref:hypothetical protein n=1 Tax=Streptomyces sp. 8L TaxID=2877242 RepID=UPI001CD42FA8|nr:hypothetical protein [Streptomyces sp. 8L]MCA1224119.1 hypothetical protein [Streptomyces sp. 8L]
MTTAPATTGEQDPYYMGRADAYDDARTLTTDQMGVRADLYAIYHPDFWYVTGYMDRLLEQRRENAALAVFEAEIAWTPLPAGTR